MDRIEKIKELLVQNGADNFLEHALALEYIKLGNDAEARRIFEELLARDVNYVGSYYHLAKLLERTGETELAINWYEKGMNKATEQGDNHSLNELRSAYDDLVY
jgi:Tfp pilus assembly protein PilF